MSSITNYFKEGVLTESYRYTIVFRITYGNVSAQDSFKNFRLSSPFSAKTFLFLPCYRMIVLLDILCLGLMIQTALYQSIDSLIDVKQIDSLGPALIISFSS